MATSMERHLVFGLVGFLLLGAVPAGCINTCNSVANRYTVEGTVTGEVGSKLNLTSGENGSSGTTKYSVPLETATGPKIVNCTSTQCAALQEGQRVELSCYEEFHFTVPNEEECRFTRLLPSK